YYLGHPGGPFQPQVSKNATRQVLIAPQEAGLRRIIGTRLHRHYGAAYLFNDFEFHLANKESGAASALRRKLAVCYGAFDDASQGCRFSSQPGFTQGDGLKARLYSPLDLLIGKVSFGSNENEAGRSWCQLGQYRVL